MSPVSRVRTEGVWAEGCTAICGVIMAEKIKSGNQHNRVCAGIDERRLAGWLHATGPFEWEGRGEPDDALSLSLSLSLSFALDPKIDTASTRAGEGPWVATPPS